MKKLNHLRHHLLEHCPSLRANPDKLLTFIEDGSVEFHPGEDLAHAYRFTAQILLMDFAGEVDDVMLPLLDWLARHQPDLQPAEAVRFEAEILNHDAVDLALSVRLTERVNVPTNDQDEPEAHHCVVPIERTEYGPSDWALVTEDRYGG